MQFIFLATPPQTEQEKKAYLMITKICQDSEHTIHDDFVYRGIKKKRANTPRISFQHIAAEIKKADAVIIEGTRSTLDIGRFIATSLQYHKPILVLYRDAIPDILDDDTHSLLTHRKYTPTNQKELKEEILNDFFTKVNKKKLLYRFNLMLNKEMNSFLMEKAKNYGISKADYIRQLINEDMD